MGSALYIVAKMQPVGVDFAMDGKALAKAEESLNSICTRLGIKRLMDFVSMDPDELADMLGEEIPGAPPEQWFDPMDGLETVRPLIKHLEAGTETIKTVTHVLQDLKDCERILTCLEMKNIRWHFSLDI